MLNYNGLRALLLHSKERDWWTVILLSDIFDIYEITEVAIDLTYYVATYILTIFFSLQFVIIAMHTDTDIWQCYSN